MLSHVFGPYASQRLQHFGNTLPDLYLIKSQIVDLVIGTKQCRGLNSSGCSFYSSF